MMSAADRLKDETRGIVDPKNWRVPKFSTRVISPSNRIMQFFGSARTAAANSVEYSIEYEIPA